MVKEVIGYEGFYTITSDGHVFNKSGKEKIPFLNRYGYKMVSLYKNTERKNKYVHRLVAEAFIKNIENKPMINHKDGNKLNNRMENLEWCTNQENQIHAVETGLNKNIGRNHLQARKVYQIKDGEIIKEWGCIKDAQKALNIFQSNIIKCCKGERKTTGGYSWKYID